MPLPAPEDGAGGAGIPQLKYGEKMRFDDLGPIIVNKDGTTRWVNINIENVDGVRVARFPRRHVNVYAHRNAPRTQANPKLDADDPVGKRSDVGAHRQAESGAGRRDAGRGSGRGRRKGGIVNDALG